MTKNEYKKLDCSISSFEFIKSKSEKFWKKKDLCDCCYGFQIQEGSKWKAGLTEQQLDDFQRQLKMNFPESLKNYYKTMNGLDKPGLNNNAGEFEIEYGPIFYAYPDDIEIIKSMITWTFDENSVTKDMETDLPIPSIFPFFGNRFLILDNEEIVLSMHGDDIIFFAENLSKGIARDIFSYYPKMDIEKFNTNSFWNKIAFNN